jgi:transcriptional regulator with XRE-family HTH domain
VDDMEIGERLRLARIEANLTMREAAERAGVNKDSISRIERGVRPPNALTVGKLARAYGRTAEEFLYPKAAAHWIAPTPEGIAEIAGVRSRWSVMSAEEWEAAIENVTEERAKEIDRELDEERRATFTTRQLQLNMRDEEVRNAAARFGFRNFVRWGEIRRKTRDLQLIAEAERIGSEIMAGAAGSW